MTHTPTPWKLINEKTIVGLDHPQQGYIADVNLHRSNDQQQPDGAANAAHIIRCVNNHDALLQALKTVIDVTAAYYQYDTTGRPWLKQALDAIAKAEGK